MALETFIHEYFTMRSEQVDFAFTKDRKDLFLTCSVASK